MFEAGLGPGRGSRRRRGRRSGLRGLLCILLFVPGEGDGGQRGQLRQGLESLRSQLLHLGVQHIAPGAQVGILLPQGQNGALVGEHPRLIAAQLGVGSVELTAQLLKLGPFRRLGRRGRA